MNQELDSFKPANQIPASTQTVATSDGMRRADYCLIAGIMLISIAVIFLPNLIVTPVQRTLLFFLVAILGAILMGRQVIAKFEMATRTYALTISGIWVVIFATILLLDHLAKPDFKVVIYSFTHEDREVNLKVDNALKLLPATTDSSVPTHYIDGNNLILWFPQQVHKVTAVITIPGGDRFRGDLNYQRNEQSAIELTDGRLTRTIYR